MSLSSDDLQSKSNAQSYFKIVLGVTGSIAAYKTPDLVRKLQEIGATVRVVLTQEAQKFVSILSLQAVSKHHVYVEEDDFSSEDAMSHIELAKWADIVLVAPSTANQMAKSAYGMADNLLGMILLATKAPVYYAPAMNKEMWNNDATKKNKCILKERGCHILGPDVGEQACGDFGFGRMLEVELIVDALKKNRVLAGYTILITLGSTWEAIDPVRFIANRSSGKMGYALALEAIALGARVIVVCGPTSSSFNLERCYKVIKVESAQEMHSAVMDEVDQADVFIGVAAVADYRPTKQKRHKVKKTAFDMTIHCEPTVDILKEVSMKNRRPFCIGFAAETENVIDYAKNKLAEKKIDMIVANLVGEGVAFGEDEQAVTIIDKQGCTDIQKTRKSVIAKKILEHLVSLLTKLTKG